MRVLVIRISALGDVLLTTPALAALRLRYPDAEIDFCTDARYVGLLRGLPTLNQVVALDRSAGMRPLLREIRRRRYDLIVDLQRKVRTVLLSRLGRPKRRLTFVKRSPSEWLSSLRGRPWRPGRHATDLYVEVLAPLGIEPLPADRRCLSIGRDPQAELEAEEALRRLNLRPGEFVALAPGAAHATKRWSPESFARLAEAVREHGIGEPLVLGGVVDRDVIEPLRLPTLPLETSLRVLAAVLRRARALVCGDTGPLHLAAAVGTPLVGIYGPTDPQRWGPVGVPHEVVSLQLPCAPCSDHGGPRCPLGTHACLRDVDVSLVLSALERVLAIPGDAG